jgi:penicillin-binding protein 2
VFFIEQGRILGLEKIADVLETMGIGQDTEFALPNAKGLLPSRAEKYTLIRTPEGKYKKKKARWNTYDTALLSIGQGYIGVTPLQAALYTAALANGGTLWRPYILKSVKDAEGNIILIKQPHARAELDIPKNTLELIHEGMSEVVRGVNGSGKNGNAKKIKLYGKTGTAQKGLKAEKGQNTWFTCFGTYKDKTYALTILVEDGSSGGRTCAPIAKKFFDTWLE